MQWHLVIPGVILLIGCGTPTVVGYLQTAAQQQAQHAADVRTNRQLQLARELPATPPDVLVALVEFVGEGGPTADSLACLMFSPAAAAQFAASVDGRDCSSAIEALHDQVSDRGTYVNAVIVPPEAWSVSGGTATVDGCAAKWSGLLDTTPTQMPGPVPGWLALTRQEGQGWLITDYRPC